MKHIHIDKAIGGTNDGATTPYVSTRPVLRLLKQVAREPISFNPEDVACPGRMEIENYRLERFMADDCLITFWVEDSLTPAAAICNLLLRYVPQKDVAEVR